MTWQDIVIAVGQLLFVLALIPSLVTVLKPPRLTCALTGTVLLLFSGTFLSLGLWYSAATAFACGTCWLVLFFQDRISNVSIITTIDTRLYSRGQWLDIDGKKFIVIQIINRNTMVVKGVE